MINVGYLAKMYQVLPSQVLASATTFDLMIMDVMATWEDSKRNPEKMDNYKIEDLEKLVKDVKR